MTWPVLDAKINLGKRWYCCCCCNRLVFPMHGLLLGITCLRLVVYCFPLPRPIGVTSIDATRLQRRPRASGVRARRDAASPPRLTLAVLLLSLSTHMWCQALSTATYVLMCGFVLCAMLASHLDWCWYCCCFCSVMFSMHCLLLRLKLLRLA